MNRDLKDNGKILLIPTSGLANRVRIIASTIRLARESNKKIAIYWDSNVGLRADFDELFEDITSIPVRKIPVKYKAWIKMTQYSSRLSGFDKWYLKLFNFDFIFLDSMAIKVWHNKMNLLSEVSNAKDVLICSGQEINYFDLEDYQLFVPKSGLRKRIENITRKFATNTIGIHIRATDNEASKKYSPLSVFINKMEDEIDYDPNRTFFVATDDEKYQEILLEQFGRERIFFHDKVFGRNVTQGIKDAVIDLFCLSRTSKIYGSYFSSFSDIAGRLGNVPVEVLKIEE
jgi:hypothetical protein